MAVAATPRSLVSSLPPAVPVAIPSLLRCHYPGGLGLSHGGQLGHQPFSALKQPRPRSLREFEVNPRPLGRGACSVVFAGRHRKTDYDVAIKVMSRAMPTETGALPVASGIENESKVFNHLLSSQGHPNLVELLGCFVGSGVEAASALGLELPQEEPVHYFVTELLEGGSLDQLVQRGPVSEETAKRLTRKICDGLLSLHSKGVVHRDLKPGNVLFGSNEQGQAEPKFIDFSHAALAEEDEESLHGELGTRGYVAPEVLAEKPYCSKCDIFSLGCLVHSLLSGKPPRRHMRIGMVQQLPATVSQEARQFLSSLLSMDFRSRPSAAEVLREPWLQEE